MVSNDELQRLAPWGWQARQSKPIADDQRLTVRCSASIAPHELLQQLGVLR
jgi:hypothetical protein